MSAAGDLPMGAVKVVFLDMDGVVNCAEWFRVTSKTQYRKERGKGKAMYKANESRVLDAKPYAEKMIDEEAVKLLNEITRRTGCKFVLSSSWRVPHTLDDVELMLCLRGFEGELIDKTPCYIQGPPDEQGREFLRGYEIAKWLETHPEVVAFAILDDGSDMAHLKFNLVQTSWQLGIQPEHVEQAVALLGECR